MRELGRRPALLVAGALIAGLFTSQAWLVPIGAVAALIWIAEGMAWRWGAFAFFAAGCLLAPEPVPVLAGDRPFRAEATVASVPDLGGGGQSCYVEAGGAKYWLFGPDEPSLAPGDLISVEGVLDGYGVREADRLKGVSGKIRSGPGGVRVLQRGPSFYRAGVGWRGSFAAYIEQALDPRAASTVNALCFNLTRDIDNKTYDNLQRTGTVHIVSASGLHVFIFALGLSAFLALLPIPRGWRLALIGAVLVVYAVGAGMRPPVIRSVAMAAVLGCATLLRREPDLLSALGAVAAGYLLWRPEAVHDVGFQLSFVTVAVLGMLLSYPDELPTEPFKRLGRMVLEVSRASLVATLASAPLTAYYFGMVSVVAVPANVLIALVLPPVTLGAFAAHGLSFVLPSLAAGIVAVIVQPLAGWILWAVEVLGSLDFAAISIPVFSAYWMLPYYLAILMIWRPRARPA